MCVCVYIYIYKIYIQIIDTHIYMDFFHIKKKGEEYALSFKFQRQNMEIRTR